MSYSINAPLVITRNEDGSDLYLYQGSPLPSHVRGDELKRLKDGGFLSGDDKPVDEKPADEKPHGNASLETWQKFAKSKGASDEDLDGLSRDEVRELYGK